MTKPPSGKSCNKIMPNPKGGGPPQVTTTSNSGTPLSHSSISSHSAGTAHVRSPIKLHSSSSTTNVGDAQEPWMETATPGKFQDFQQKIFPIVEFLISILGFLSAVSRIHMHCQTSKQQNHQKRF